MIDFKKFFEENRIEHHDCVDISFFFTRAEILRDVLEIFTKELKKWEEAVLPKETGRDQEVHGGFDDEILQTLLEEFIKPGYEPPADNLTGLQLHLMGMTLFFSRVDMGTMTAIQHRQIIQLDDAMLRLITAVMYATASLQYEGIPEAERKNRVRAGNARRKQTSRDRIAAAYRKLPPVEWNGKTPHLEGEKISLSDLADLVRDEMKKAGIAKPLKEKQVIFHVLELKKMGNL